MTMEFAIVLTVGSTLQVRFVTVSLLSHLSHLSKALKSLICADVPFRNYSLTHSC